MLDPAAYQRDLTTRQREKIRLAHLTPAAIERGLDTGMNSVRASARCPEFTLIEPDPHAEANLRQRLIDAALSLSPDVESTRPDLALIDLSSVVSHPSQIDTWAQAQIPTLRRLGIPIAFATAATPDLADLTAYCLADSLNDFTSISFHHLTDPARLHDYPLENLAALFSQRFPSPAEANDFFRVLDLWGIDTLGNFASLDPADLHERLGSTAVLLHHIVTGRSRRPLRLVRASTEFSITHHLEHTIDSLEPLNFLLKNLLATLTARLQAHQRVPRSIDLTLDFETGEDALRTFRIPEPTNDSDALARILHTYLEGQAIPAPICKITLHAQPVLPGEAQHQLFTKRQHDPNRFAETLGRLSALLGVENIGIPSTRSTHTDDDFILRPAEEILNPKATTTEIVEPAKGLPMQRFRPPRPVTVMQTPDPTQSGRLTPRAVLSGSPSGAIRDARGPYLTRSQWWDPAESWSRAEWDVQLEDKSLMRLAQVSTDEWQWVGKY